MKHFGKTLPIKSHTSESLNKEILIPQSCSHDT